MPTTLIIGQEAVLQLLSKAASGNSRPCAFSAKVSDYSLGYVAVVGSGLLHVVSKAIGSFSLTVTGHSQDGTPMTSKVYNFTVTGVPVEQADHFEDSGITVKNGDITTPADPGTDTVTGSL